MSILMEALKQQSSPQQAADNTAAFWRKVALLLALLVALLTGALLAYWLQSATIMAPAQTAAVPEPAQPAAILAALQQAPSAPPAPEPVKLTVQETLAAEKPLTTVTLADDSDADKGAAPVAVAAAEPAPDIAVSEELRAKFAQAMQATQQGSNSTAIRSHSAPAQDISTLDAAMLRQIPPLRFDAHVFATSATQRWVKVNGKTLQEGQWITADIRIREITQQYVLLELGTQLFSMSALSEWPAS